MAKKRRVSTVSFVVGNVGDFRPIGVDGGTLAEKIRRDRLGADDDAPPAEDLDLVDGPIGL